MIPKCEIICGDALEKLKDFPPCVIQCAVTSPPYYGLRDYGTPGQIGLENSVEEYVSKLVSVASEIRRVLAEDGTFWLNLGDSYYNYRPGLGQKQSKQSIAGEKFSEVENCPKRGLVMNGLKEKDLMLIPHRVALALQADGWWIRSEIIWHKRNSMPESVKDRPTRNHEQIFLLSKGQDYYYDWKAIQEPSSSNGARNKRSVWSVTMSPSSDDHFAAYPPDLIRPCILAGSRFGDTVLDPFAGKGTTGQVATELGRNSILIELNPKYAAMCELTSNVTPSLPFL